MACSQQETDSSAAVQMTQEDQHNTVVFRVPELSISKQIFQSFKQAAVLGLKIFFQKWLK